MKLLVSYLFTGVAFVVLGIKWAWNFALCESKTGENDGRRCKGIFKLFVGKSSSACLTEGSLKAFLCVIGIIILAFKRTEMELDEEFAMMTLYILMYVYFMLSGCIDLLSHFFPVMVDASIVRFSLMQCFVMEGILFYNVCYSQNGLESLVYTYHQTLTWICLVATSVEEMFGAMFLVRPMTTFAKGTWMIHGGLLILYGEKNSGITHRLETLWINIYFSVHCFVSYVIVIAFVLIRRGLCKNKPKRSSLNYPEDLPVPVQDVHPQGPMTRARLRKAETLRGFPVTSQDFLSRPRLQSYENISSQEFRSRTRLQSNENVSSQEFPSRSRVKSNENANIPTTLEDFATTSQVSGGDSIVTSAL